MSDPPPVAKRLKTAGDEVTTDAAKKRSETVDCAVTIKFSSKASASIFKGDEQVGSIRGHIVARNKNFHRKCDEISADLQGIGCIMFEPDGSNRCVELLQSRTKKKGSFLYIHTMSLKDGFKENSDIGTRAIAEFLTALEGKWTVAAYIGDDLEALTEVERREQQMDEHEAFLIEMRGVIQIPDEEKFQNAVKRRKGVSADVRQFVRNGFQELSEETVGNVGYMYITEEMWKEWKPLPDKLSHEDSLAVTLRADAPLNKEAFKTYAKDEELIRFLKENSEELSKPADFVHPFGMPVPRITAETIMARVMQLVREGADINRSNALHVCAANGMTPLFDPLVHQGALVNAKDEQNMTPLMLAARHAPGNTTKFNPTPPIGGIRALLGLGANKDITDGVGRTALGHFYDTVRGYSDMAECFGSSRAKEPLDPTIEGLLLPSGGPTEADKRCRKK